MALTTVNPSMIGQTATGASSLTATGSGAASLVTAAGTALSADSSGRVTMPYQPAFQAHVSSSGTLTTAGNDIIFGTAVTNIGSNYNTTNGRFTAPIAGNYFFTFSVLKGNTTGLEVRYLKNNSDYHDSLWAKDNTSVANNTISCSAVIAMSANDYVTVNVYYGTAYGDYTNFSGFLIG